MTAKATDGIVASSEDAFADEMVCKWCARLFDPEEGDLPCSSADTVTLQSYVSAGRSKVDKICRIEIKKRLA